MAPSEGKRLLCLGKQLNYVWSVSELDKKKKLRSKKIAGIRGWIQAAATLLTNPHIPNFFQGKIYQGKAKTVCVPGLNCYSCPAATGACPIGAFQAVVGSSKFKFSYYITGFLILLGVTLGRFICGFLCPFGWFQDLLHKIPRKEILYGQTEAAAVSEIYHPCCFCDSFCRCLQRIRSGWEIRSSANIFVRRAFWRGRSRFPSEMPQSGLHWASCFRLNSVF